MPVTSGRTLTSIGKRLIHSASVGKGLYSSKSRRVVKKYLESDALKQWAKNTPGVDDKGAYHAEVTQVLGPYRLPSCLPIYTLSGSGHSGGTNRSEKFHLNVKVTDKAGKVIPAVDPRTKKPTKTWHAHVANSSKDLKAKAVTWNAATSTSRK